MPRPFRFSITGGGVLAASEFVELATKAEDLGYAAISLPDHLDGQLAPIPALTAAAVATSSIRLTTLVLANDYRHPAMLAKEAATLDLISDGRLELGIGAGWMRSDYDQAGLPYDKPSVRIARLEESVQILQTLLAGEPCSFRGDHYAIDGLVNTPAAVQQPVPLFIAGGGQKILSVAAKYGDIVGFNPGLAAGVIDERAGATASPSATDQKLAWIKAAAGDRYDSIEFQTRVHLATITDDAAGMAEAMGPAMGLSAAETLDSPHVLAGTLDEVVERLQQWRERWGISYIGMSSDAIEEMAPVVARLAGT